MCRARFAFTLTEMLVALAIVALTAAILTPVFFTARARSRQTACLSNMRQLALAMKMYAQDNDDTYPPVSAAAFDATGRARSTTGAWNQLLQPYTGGQMFRCPDRELPGRLAERPDHRSHTGYAMNDRLNLPRRNTAYIEGRTEFNARYPALTVAVFDARAAILSMSAPDLRANQRYINLRNSRLNEEIEAQTEGAIRHRGGANYAFADGHAAWHRPGSLRVAPTSDGRTPGFGL